MTKHFGYEPGDFHFDEAHRRTSLTARVLPRLFDFCLPLAIGLLALYIGRNAFGG
jgi:hypothetical protein